MNVHNSQTYCLQIMRPEDITHLKTENGIRFFVWWIQLWSNAWTTLAQTWWNKVIRQQAKCFNTNVKFSQIGLSFTKETCRRWIDKGFFLTDRWACLTGRSVKLRSRTLLSREWIKSCKMIYLHLSIYSICVKYCCEPERCIKQKKYPGITHTTWKSFKCQLPISQLID